MGQLDFIKSYTPESIQPDAAYNSPLQNIEYRVAKTYANPTNFGLGTLPGPFTVAGISETQHAQFTQDRWNWPTTNVMIVSVPERPIDGGTLDAIAAGISGVYLQKKVTGTTKQYSGSAPVQGVYTGYLSSSADLEECK